MPVYALVDCNNFYCSCERVFAPHLAGRPVVVLTNNDGCIIARSPEAKALGFKMAEPEFQARARLKRHNVAVFSSNYALYGDLSARVMSTLSEFTPRMEVYSIDEAFLDIAGMPEEAGRYAARIRETVRKRTGIPVSIGIGPTKTLAKAANKLAKKRPELGGVLDMSSLEGREKLLSGLDVEDVWGIGHRHSKRLKAMGVMTAQDFTRLSREWVLKKMTVVGLHTWLELRGIPCISMEMAPKPKQTIVSSRSFGKPVTTLEEMGEAMTRHASRAAEKLRGEKGLAGAVLVFIQTNNFIEGEPQYWASQSRGLNPPTSHTPEIVCRGREILERIFRMGFRYKKVGVMLSGIESEASAQFSLLPSPGERGKQLMDALDRVNAKWGRETLFVAATGTKRVWSMRQNFRSPRYTTVWGDLPYVTI
ncbi:Y-family DNA polymerase [Fundidesulfovibrio terrae]|uniref:Y-family DNA polymerase n=1 Tax=Fundidesulfovibrio terrae TaxID=2922866 RepID=UPI001FAF1896|nr:Y-family DNA polymerase [Fundidesulfovibrio terrae]